MARAPFVAVMVVAGWLLGAERADACPTLPPAIQADGFITPIVEELLAASGTFRAQCERIAAAPLVRVAVQILPTGAECLCRARTTMRRYPSGLLIAMVEIPLPRTALEHAELIGHEFEHVLEQIEAVDLNSKAAGAVRLPGGAFETARAKRAGAAVAAEAEQALAATRQ